ncbi:prephenate dehydrogenase/arogenate dehydrogenase family protein, partial [Parasphingorhabdus sp.]|uniref:prephenate dehydrogenase/arogenate dehydrogenase family protein n=1 Tax=Parasphingorhabdus sp. TaxID=2709688 RepID=UPI003C70F46C
MLPFVNIAIIGLGLIGSSIAHAARQSMPSARITGFDSDSAVRARVIELGFCDDVSDNAGAAVIDADLVMLCVPVGVIAAVAA